MPYKEGIVVVVAHLSLKAIPRIVKLVGGGTEQVAHCIGNTVVCSISKIRRQRVVLYCLNHRRSLGHLVGPCRGGIEFRSVAACNVGDVPDGISSGTILESLLNPELFEFHLATFLNLLFPLATL